MKKRILSLILAALILSSAALTGCSEGTQNTDETQSSGTPSAAESTAAEEETELTRANTPDDLPELDY